MMTPHRARAFAVRIFLAITIAHGAAIGVWALLRMTRTANSPWIELISNLMPLPLLPAAPLFALALFWLWRRRSKRALLAVLATLSPVAQLSAQLIHGYARDPEEQPTTPTIRIATFNLYGREIGYEPVVDVIGGINADVIVLQEIGPNTVAALNSALADRYLYRAWHPVPGTHIAGQAVLSRFPIVESTFRMDGLGQQRVILDVNGLALSVYNAHAPVPFRLRQLPPYDGRDRDRVIANTLAQIAAERNPVILAGDFNMTDRSVMHDAITAQLDDAWRAVGSGPGATWPAAYDQPDYPMQFPSNLIVTPLSRIDYLFYSRELRPLSARVWPTGAGSDHRPVVAVFALPSANTRQ